jgi:hypothetical protein
VEISISKNLNLHNGINITNEFLKAVQEDADFRLIDPKTNEPVKIVNARDLWWQIINARAETGEPYMVNIDTCNEALPKEQKDLGLEIKQSNLCSEITLPTNEERTAVCCLSSVNLEYFDEWSENPLFIDDLITMLDNVLQHYIDNAVDTNNLGEYNANFKRFQKHIKPGKEGFLNLPTLLIEKGRWVLVRWDSIRISNHATFLLKVSSLRALITKHLNTLRDIRLEQLNDLLMNVVSHLMSVVVVGVMLIYSLLLLMLLLVSYVVVRLLRLSHTGLTFIRTKLSQVLSKLKTNT